MGVSMKAWVLPGSAISEAMPVTDGMDDVDGGDGVRWWSRSRGGALRASAERMPIDDADGKHDGDDEDDRRCQHAAAQTARWCGRAARVGTACGGERSCPAG